MRPIYWVTGNFDSEGDGVGKFTARLVEAMNGLDNCPEIDVFTADTLPLSKLGRLFSLKMAHSLYRAAFSTLRHSPRAVVLEYPFLEWSPFILPAALFLKLCCRLKSAKMLLSVHEYLRVGKARVYSIRFLGKLADALLATDEATKSALKEHIRKPVFLRSIPSNIPAASDASPRDPKGFCFFGIVNPSKAIAEMLEGWKAAYSKGMTLTVLSANAEIDLSDCPGVKLERGLSDEALARRLSENTFLILPIRPEVGPHNGTLKAGLLNGMVPIGKPGEGLGKLRPLFIEMPAYAPESFAEAVRSAMELSETERKSREEKAREAGKEWSSSRTAGEIREAMNQLGIW